ncbi:hypothetical protein IEO21_02935 [Rhodonia placenta]|uniref:Uncharacterized protein n=1 Tax=Rhodonia placenta TaxID=104341 RepID=A0A8H7U4L9_9APHY|nr:hypothetical protein IEO21_02935 [Postia placenta]
MRVSAVLACVFAAIAMPAMAYSSDEFYARDASHHVFDQHRHLGHYSHHDYRPMQYEGPHYHHSSHHHERPHHLSHFHEDHHPTHGYHGHFQRPHHHYGDIHRPSHHYKGYGRRPHRHAQNTHHYSGHYRYERSDPCSNSEALRALVAQSGLDPSTV